MTAAATDNAVFHWSVCAAPLPAAHVCPNASAWIDELGGQAAVIVAGAGPAQTCTVLGVMDDAFCMLTDAARPTAGISCLFPMGGVPRYAPRYAPTRSRSRRYPR